MKQTLLLVSVVLLLAACNNNNPLTTKDTGTTTGSQDEKKEDKKGGGLFGGGGEEEQKASNWTAAQRQEWLGRCVEDFDDKAEGRKVCSCVIDKLEKKYPNAADVASATEEEGNRLIASCKTGMVDEQGGGMVNEDNDQTGGATTSESGGNWTELQRQTYVKGCVGTAKQQPGMTLQKATSYCECMTSKIEQVYSFDQAARLTAADLGSTKWKQAIQNCLTGDDQ